MDMRKLKEQFSDVEQRLSLFEDRIAGVSYWSILRHPVFQRILSRSALSGMLPSGTWRRDWWRVFGLLGPEQFRTILGRKRRKKYLFWASGRRTKVGGRYIDISSDYPAGLLNEDDVLVIEAASNLRHYRPTPRKVAPMDLLRIAAFVGARFVGAGLCLSPRTMAAVSRVRCAVNRGLGGQVLGHGELRMTVATHLVRRALYRWFLRRRGLERIFLNCYYGSEAVVEAARSLGIATTEIQHGVIDRYHLAYDLPYPGANRYTPDDILVFGRFWKDACRLYAPPEHVHVYGRPHLTTASPPSVERRADVIVVLSQWTVGEALSRFVVALRRQIEPRYRICYRFHPDERARAQRSYPWLFDCDIELDFGSGMSLFDRLRTSRWQLGVYSTAVYEGLYLGCVTFIYKTEGHEYMDKVLRAGYARLVEHVADVDLAYEPRALRPEELFDPNWRENFMTFIRAVGAPQPRPAERLPL